MNPCYDNHGKLKCEHANLPECRKVGKCEAWGKYENGQKMKYSRMKELKDENEYFRAKRLRNKEIFIKKKIKR